MAAPISLYGASKLASEALVLEYGYTFNLPVWINRCGVLAGPGQFGRADQGIFAFWINAWLRRERLRYIGFGGHGYQVRDCLHPRDLASVLWRQISSPSHAAPKTCNFSGGIVNSMSLAELSGWCTQRFGKCSPEADLGARPYDIPWLILDYNLARSTWNWEPQINLEQILEEIARHAEENPNWLALSSIE